MPLIIQTLSGEIETGFCAGYMAEVCIGDYTVPTTDLCQLLGMFADDPSARRGKLWMGNRREYTGRMNDHLVSWTSHLLAAFESGSLEHLSTVKTQLAAKQGAMSGTGWMEFAGGSNPIEVVVDDAAWVVCVGKHKIPTVEFREFARYIANGGLLGWANRQTPPFAQGIAGRIKQSRNPAYAIAASE